MERFSTRRRGVTLPLDAWACWRSRVIANIPRSGADWPIFATNRKPTAPGSDDGDQLRLRDLVGPVRAQRCRRRHASPYVRKAVDFIVSRQREDGGWGEDCASYPERRYEAKVSTPSQTSWALLGLMAAGEVDSPAVQRGVDYLLGAERRGTVARGIL